MQDLNLNVGTPEELAPLLRRAAEMYRESQSELQSAWQDRGAGRVWGEFAKILESAADRCDKAAEKYV